MPVFLGDIIQVSWRGVYASQRIILTRSYRVDPGPIAVQPTQTTLTQINSALAVGGTNPITSSYLACLPVNYSLLEIRSQVIRPLRSAFFSNFFTGVIGTNVTSTANVGNDSAAVNFRTANGGRNQVSVVKIGPVPSTSAVLGAFNAPYLTALSAFATAYSAAQTIAANSITITPIIAHPSGTFDAITNFTIGAFSRVIRRRTVGVGE